MHLLTVNKRPIEPLKKAKLIFERHFYRTLDFDGLVGSLKPVCDALTKLKIIEDDKWDVVGAWEVNQVFRPKKDGPLLKIIVVSVDK